MTRGSQEADLAVGFPGRQGEQGSLNELVAAQGACGTKPELPLAPCVPYVLVVETPFEAISPAGAAGSKISHYRFENADPESGEPPHISCRIVHLLGIMFVRTFGALRSPTVGNITDAFTTHRS